MKNKNIISQVVFLFAFLLATSTSFAQITTEEDMAKAVYETIKNSDLETFSSYCTTDEKMTEMLEGMEESTPKEQSVKKELKEENFASFRDESINKYNELIDELNTKNIAIGKGVFSDLTSKTRVEVPNCKAINLKFVMNFNDKIHYQISMDVFKTETDLFIYSFKFHDLYEHKP